MVDKCKTQLGWGQNNGCSTDMASQISVNVWPEFSCFWRVMQSLFSLRQPEKRVCLRNFEGVTKCESDIDKHLYFYILTIITLTRYSGHYFTFYSNFTNHIFVETYWIFCWQLDSNDHTLNSHCPVAICI